MREKEYLQALGEHIDSKLPDNHGFILLTFPLANDPGSRCHYIGNVSREEALAAMREFMIIASGDGWMKHML